MKDIQELKGTGTNKCYSSSDETTNTKLFVKDFTDSYAGVAAELAAYKLAKACGLNVIETSKAVLNGREVMVQPFISDFNNMFGYKFTQEELNKIFTFDWVIGNPDRHPNNVMVIKDKLFIIDHERAFQGTYDMRNTFVTRVDYEWSRWCKYTIYPDQEVLDLLKEAVYTSITIEFPQLNWDQVRRRLHHTLANMDLDLLSLVVKF